MMSCFGHDRRGEEKKQDTPVMPRSQPLMMGPARARTSLGSRGMSNDCGIGAWPWKTLRTD
jgi:hypothetical protein